jgi:hypothetical protein
LSYCWNCNDPITKENESIEHIFLNSIGGKLKSKNLLCQNCNSNLGNTIDVLLSRQLNFFSNMLNIKREEGISQPVEATNNEGEKFLIKPGGIPERKRPTIIVDKGKLFISVKSKKEAKTVLSGLKRKIPNIDVDKIVNESEIKQEYLDENIETTLAIGGESLRSVCKSAINYYMLNNGCRKNILHLIPYINSNENLHIVKYYYESDVFQNSSGIFIHGIALKGDSRCNLLFAYIEFFSTFKFVVLLNGNYKGRDFECTYAYDILQTKEIFLTTNIPSFESIMKIINSPNCPINELQLALSSMVKKIHDKQTKDQIKNMINRALRRSLLKYSEGTIITAGMIREYCIEIKKEIEPWLAHMMEISKQI